MRLISGKFGLPVHERLVEEKAIGQSGILIAFDLVKETAATLQSAAYASLMPFPTIIATTEVLRND